MAKSFKRLNTLSDPFDSQTWYLLGRAYMEFCDMQRALQKFHEAIYRNGTFPGYWHSLGVAYYILDNLRECIACFSNSLRLNPYIPENWYCLGVLVSGSKWNSTNSNIRIHS
jgi:cytochrome c-type biogenesis protein CcmH/NrfG